MNVLRKLGYFGEAEALYHQALQQHPQTGSFYRDLGALLEQQNRLEEAAKVYRKGIQRTANDPDPVNFQFQLIDLLLQQQKLDEAIALSQQTLPLANLPDHYVQLSDRLAKQNRLKEANALYNQIATAYRQQLRLYAGAPYARFNDPFRYAELASRLIDVLVKQNKLPEAIAITREFQLPRVYPFQDGLDSSLLYSLVRQKRIAEAIALCRQKIQQEPVNYFWVESLGYF